MVAETIEPPSTLLNDVHPGTLRNLSIQLNMNGEWKRLLTALPPRYSPISAVQERLRKEDTCLDGNPSKTLMEELGNMCFTVSQLADCLERLSLENALVLIKKPEQVTITGDLPAEVEIEAGPYEHFSISCSATGFPSPQYQWFKFKDGTVDEKPDWIQLDGCQSSVFTLEPVRLDNAGLYCCRVSNRNPGNGSNYSCCFSRPMNLILTRSTNLDPPVDRRMPEVILQPCAANRGAVTVGTSLCLTCRAVGEEPLTYEWYQNGRLISGKNDGNLTVENLQSIDDETKFSFLCRVSNYYGSTLSNVVNMRLANPVAPFVKSQYTAEDKVALLFGNEEYEDSDLTAPVLDATKLAISLRDMDFKVITLVNLTKTEMEKVVNEFCNLIDAGVYVVFYYAGHGYQRNGQCYMQPVDADIDSPSNFVCLDNVIGQFQLRNPAVCLMIIDMCRRDPQIDIGEKDVACQPVIRRNTVFAYSTTNLCGALDGLEGENGIYMKHLLKYIKDEMPIVEMLNKVVYEMGVDSRASKKQYPEVVFNLGLPRKLTDKVISADSNRAKLRRQHYEMLIDHHPNFATLGMIPGTVIHVFLEPHSHVVHNVLSVKLYVSSDRREELYAVVNSIETSGSKARATFSQVVEGSPKCLCVLIKGLQKIKEPLKLKVVTVDEGRKLSSRTQFIKLDYPNIAKLINV